MKEPEEPLFRLDGFGYRKRLYARGAVPGIGGVGLTAFMLWYYLFIEALTAVIIFALLGIFLAVQGFVIWAGAARNPDFAIYPDRVVVPRTSPVASLRTVDFSIPIRRITDISASAEDRFIIETRTSSHPIAIRDFTTDEDEVADVACASMARAASVSCRLTSSRTELVWARRRLAADWRTASSAA